MSSSKQIKGKALNLIQYNSNARKYELNIKPIEAILMSPNTKDCEVSILSVAGALRGGKSFLLSFLIRYLHSATVLNETENWMGDPNEKLTGFEWIRGTKRHTTGILIWSDIFYYKIGNRKIAIILMDTQGTFDAETTLKDNITIFAFSSMIASIQLFNISERIQEDYLNDLQLFTEYGKYVLQNTNFKPFQSLMFLIRDWSNNDEYQYGEIDGLKYLSETLKIDTKQHEELKKIRNHIRSCYENLKCFLLPHPGLEAVDDKYFQGKISDLEDEFIVSLKELAKALLAKENIVVKTVNGKILKAHELVNFIKCYWKTFQSDEMPKPKLILDAASEAACRNARSTGITYYKIKMGTLITEKNMHITTVSVMAYHEKYLRESIKIFNDNAILGSEDFKELFRTKLIGDIKSSLKTYLDINETKAVQIEVKQLQRLKIQEEAKSNQYSNTFKNLNSEVQAMSESNKTRCGRSSVCEDRYCPFDVLYMYHHLYSGWHHQCDSHFCPGTFHSKNCVQYREYDQCQSTICRRCGRFH